MKKSAFFPVLMVSFFTINAQDPVSVFNFKRDSIPVEHIYMHFDQQAYVAGETIWFKGYLYSSFANSTLSSNFFVDLLDENNRIIIAKKLPVFGGTIQGSIVLPDTLAEGPYLLRAYTVWTLNLNEAFVFKKGIAVFNPGKKMPVNNLSKRTNHCDFYPESGQLVNGLLNMIAFKAENDFLQVLNISGTITDTKGNEITKFISNDQGLGTFSFVPEKGENYFANIEFPDGTSQRYNLPAAINEGVLLNVGDNSKGKVYSISASPSSGNDFDELLMLAVMQNNVVVEKKIILEKHWAQGIINTNELPAGLLQFVLFDKNNKLIARRNTFLDNDYIKLAVQLTADTLDFSKKAKNVFTLSFPDSVNGSFSISVTDADSELTKNNSNIISGLLLQSGNDQFIANREVPLNKTGWDLLALTNNWTIDLQHKEVKFRDQPYISFAGKVFEKSGNRTITDKEISITIETKDSSQAIFTVPVLPDGSFRVENLVFEDTARFLYHLNTPKNAEKSISIKLDAPNLNYTDFWNTANTSAYFNFNRPVFIENSNENRIKEIHRQYSQKAAKGTMLQEVVVKSKKLSPTEEINKKYTSGLFRSAPGSKTVDFINEPPRSGAMNIFEYLRGKISGLTIEYKNGRYSIESGRSISLNDARAGNGLVDGKVYLNESEVDANILAQVSISQIALVKFFPPGSLMLPGTGISCVLAVYTKQFDEVNSFIYPGYSVTKSFSSPDYSKAEKNTTDIRRTLYWDPNLVLDGKTKEIKIRFYNSDRAKKFKIVLEGFTDSKLVHFEKVLGGE